MIEIAISREMADGSPAFIDACAQRGHRVDVFEGETGTCGGRSEQAGPGTPAPDVLPGGRH